MSPLAEKKKNSLKCINLHLAVSSAGILSLFTDQAETRKIILYSSPVRVSLRAPERKHGIFYHGNHGGRTLLLPLLLSPSLSKLTHITVCTIRGLCSSGWWEIGAGLGQTAPNPESIMWQFLLACEWLHMGLEIFGLSGKKTRRETHASCSYHGFCLHGMMVMAMAMVIDCLATRRSRCTTIAIFWRQWKKAPPKAWKM